MELDLALTARRAVVSLSILTEWLTLKTAIFMTTKRNMYARLLPVPRHFLHRPTGMLTVGGVSWQGYVSFAESNPRPTHVHVTFHRPAGTLRALVFSAGRAVDSTTMARQR